MKVIKGGGRGQCTLEIVAYLLELHPSFTPTRNRTLSDLLCTHLLEAFTRSVELPDAAKFWPDTVNV